MSGQHKQYEEAWAILRIDLFHFRESPDAPFEARDVDQLAQLLVVKEVVRDRELAEREVARLNQLNADKDCRYWLSRTRVFPPGKAFGSA